MIFWKKFDVSCIKGALIKGDPKSWQDNRWNYFFLIGGLWKTVCVLEAKTDRDFYVGYYTVNKNGEKIGILYRKYFCNPVFRVGHRRDDCHFFAIDKNTGQELDIHMDDKKIGVPWAKENIRVI